MMRRILPAVLIALLPVTASAAPPTPAAKAALALADDYIIPHYQALAAAAFANQRAWAAFCNGRAAPREKTLVAAYHALADRWAGIEFIRMGPMSLFFRHERFNYWPDPRDATGRNLAALLASNDPKALEPETFAHDSIPAQGLSALERLLFEPDLVAHPNRCRVGLGIAHNLAAIATAVTAEWAGAAGVRFSIAANRDWRGVFADGDEAARLLLTDLVAGFAAMNDQKLLAPMGPSAGAARPRLAEAWRSRRSQRNLVLNMTGLRDAVRALMRDMSPEVASGLMRRFDGAVAAVKLLPDDIGAAAANARARGLLEGGREAIRIVQRAIVASVPPALGITLGFNALDGD